MTAHGHWHFRQMQPGEMNIDPIESEFFSTEALDSLADALIREAVQNSLDARRPGERLTMRVCFPAPPDAAVETVCREALDGLRPHLDANRSGLSALPGADEPLSCVIIEDFGTRGLQGDPQQSEDDVLDDDQGPRNDFFYFWRNVGRSRKHAADLGRWGLGKTVFQAASRINAFFGLTVRADDSQRLLLGQSVLKIHKLDGHRYYPYGYYGRFDDAFALPIADSHALDTFANDFGLKRTTEPGLSVVIPYPDGDITPDAVTASLIRHYFMPIISGEMVAEVAHGEDVLRLDAGTLIERAEAGGDAADARLGKVIELARWAHELERSEFMTVAPPPVDAAPKWADDCLDAEAIDALHTRFDANQPVALSVPVWVKPASGEPILSSFDVFVERDDDLGAADQRFVRDGITIAGVRTTMPRGMRALVSVRDRALSELLGDSENPAHTEWQERSPKFKNRYRHGPFTLRYVKNAPRELVRLLTQPSEARDFRLLRNLFSLEMPTEDAVRSDERNTQQAGAGDSTAEPVEIEATAHGPRFALQRVRGGFRLKGAAAVPDTPPLVTIRTAYDVRRGNPFVHYQPFDFDLAQTPMQVVVDKAQIVSRRDNELVIAIKAADFQISVSGFDPHRDVRVKVEPADNEAAA